MYYILRITCRCHIYIYISDQQIYRNATNFILWKCNQQLIVTTIAIITNCYDLLILIDVSRLQVVLKG